MRLRITGVSPEVSTQDLCAKFASLGTIVDCCRPEPRYLGGDPLHREYAFVEVADVDQARLHKLISALNGSVWRGNKIKIAEAHPDYKGRHALEEQQDAEADLAADEPSEPSDDIKRHFNIRTPSGKPIAVPIDGTGTKRMLFRPVPPRPVQEWLPLDPEPPHSAAYHLNQLWDDILESALNRDPPPASVFLPARPNVRPFPPVAASSSVPVFLNLSQASPYVQPFNQPAQPAPPPSKPQPTGPAVTAGLVFSDDGEEELGGAAEAVVFSDDDTLVPAAPRAAKLRAERILHAYHSSDDDDTLPAATGPAPEEQLLVVRRQGKDTQRHGHASAAPAFDTRQLEGWDDGDEVPLDQLGMGQDMLMAECDAADDSEGMDALSSPAPEQLPRAAEAKDPTDAAADVPAVGGGVSPGEGPGSCSASEPHSGAFVRAPADSAGSGSDGDADRGSLPGDSTDAGTDARGELWPMADSAAAGGSEASRSGSDAGAGASLSTSISAGSGEGTRRDGGAVVASAEAAAAPQAAVDGDGATSEEGGQVGGEGEEEGGAAVADDAWRRVFALAAGEAAGEAAGSEGGAEAGAAEAEDGEGVDGDGLEEQAGEGAAGADASVAADGGAADGAAAEGAAADVAADAGAPAPVKRRSSLAQRSPGAEVKGWGRRVRFEVDGDDAERAAASGGAGGEGGVGDGDDLGEPLIAELQELEQQVAAERSASRKAQKQRKPRHLKRPREPQVDADRAEDAAAASAGGAEPGSGMAAAPAGKLAKLFQEGRRDAVKVDPPAERVDVHAEAVKALFAEVPFQAGRLAVPKVSPAPKRDVPVKAAASAPAKLEKATDYMKKIQPAAASDHSDPHPGASFYRSEDLAVLEGRLKAARPSLQADFRSKLRTQQKRRAAASELKQKRRKS